MVHSSSLKRKSIVLRKQGLSLKEIAEKLNISKSTASLWLSDIELPKFAYEKLREKQLTGRNNAIKFKRLKIDQIHVTSTRRQPFIAE